MSLNLNADSGAAFQLHPEGIFAAVCIGVMDQGFIDKEDSGGTAAGSGKMARRIHNGTHNTKYI